MVLFNYSTKELTAKVVYYGPGLCGKTTNLQWIHEKVPIKNKGKMLSLATETDRTLFFDFLPIELGTIRGMKTRIQLYTVPGQVFYNATRRMVLKGADCLVFVCDSQEAMLEANIESMVNLKQNIEANEIDPGDVPMVLQYNKRDLPNALPIEILNEKLNPRGLPFFEAVAVKGTGVEDTLKGATQLVFRNLASKYGGEAQARAAAEAPAPAAVRAPASVPPSTAPAAARPVAAPAAAAAPPAPAPRPTPAAAPRPAVSAPPPQPRPTPQPPPPPVSTEPVRRAPAPHTLPPLNMTATEASEEILESLELEPANDEVLEDTGPVADESGEEISVSIEELSSPVEVVEAAAPAPRVRTSETLATTPREAEKLRRRIRTPIPEVKLDALELEEEDEYIEEITLEPEPAVPAPSARRAKAGRPADAAITVPPVPVPPHQYAPSVVTVPPVPVRLSQVPGQADVTIPLAVSVDNGEAEVLIRVRLTLDIKSRS